VASWTSSSRVREKIGVNVLKALIGARYSIGASSRRSAEIRGPVSCYQGSLIHKSGKYVRWACVDVVCYSENCGKVWLSCTVSLKTGVSHAAGKVQPVNARFSQVRLSVGCEARYIGAGPGRPCLRACGCARKGQWMQSFCPVVRR
jgi:hypothetical protein